MELLAGSPLLAIMVVVTLGAAFGVIPFGPLRFGAAGALFVGLAIGGVVPGVGEGLGVVQGLGLGLFVYMVGLAAGDTFFADLRKQLPLMTLGVGVVVVGIAVATAVGLALGLDAGLITGTFAGALTSTPALAAATQATGSANAAVGYSLGYPIGVVLAILAVALVVGRSWPGPHDPRSAASEGLLATLTLVERPAALREVPGWADETIKMSYLVRGGRTRVLAPGEDLAPGDHVLVVGAPQAVD
ncbi:MAG: transporter, partial [Actinomycetes bacterium]